MSSDVDQAPESALPAPPPPPPDSENPAIIDARKTLKWTLIGAALFIGSAFYIILFL